MVIEFAKLMALMLSFAMWGVIIYLVTLVYSSF